MQHDKPKPPPMQERWDPTTPTKFWASIVVPIVVTLLLLGIVFLSIGLKQAYGAPPAQVDPNSPTAQWYRSLKLPGASMGCCSLADCRPVDAKIEGGHWEAFYDDKWIVIPDDKILHVDNLEGRAVMCYMESIGGVLCFVPPEMS